MPLNFLGKKPSAPVAQKAASASSQQANTAASSGSISFLKRGSAAREAIAKQEKQDEIQKESYGKLWRFWLTEDESNVSITFLDGDVDKEGMLDVMIGYEHRVKFNGKTENFMCTADIDKEAPCPLCERGDTKSEMLAYLTVIDHTPRVIQSGQNKGKTVQHKRKLFAFKKTTLRLLTTIAKKRGGLRGARFDVTRSSDKSPNVGDNFDFTEKLSIDQVQSKYGLTGEDSQPANYEDELSYRTPEELIELGVGKKPTGIGYGTGLNKTKKSDLAGEL